AKVFSKACQMDQVSLASVMMRLLCRGNWVCPHLASSDQETLLFNTVRLLSCCGVFRGNYCIEVELDDGPVPVVEHHVTGGQPHELPGAGRREGLGLVAWVRRAP